MSGVVGWDIGGAHLKAVRAQAGRVLAAVQVAAPLRLGLAALEQSFAEAKAAVGTASRHIVTMTGELADTFASRAEGVQRLAALAARALAPDEVCFYGGRSGILSIEETSDRVEDIASANWHATASLVAHRCGTAILMDMGSTTTDIVAVVKGAVAAHGYTDAERLATGELVYTGLVRSFVMATASRAPFRGCWTSLINENFASMADVHRVLGTLPQEADLMTTANGRQKTVAGSRIRMARMVGCDAAHGDDREWMQLASWFAEAQLRAVTDGAHLVLSQRTLPAKAPIVGAGSGDAILREVARRLAREYIPFDTLLDAAPELRQRASFCAPAAALAIVDSVGVAG